MTKTADYAALGRQLRARLRWRQACLAQAADLPDPDDVTRWALQIELLRRVESALVKGDHDRLAELAPTMRQVLG